MKTIYLILICLLCFNVSATNEPTPDFSFFVIEGDILHKERANITVFIFDTVECQWQQQLHLVNKKYYELSLDPTESYQIWFQSKSGYNKILYVDPGDIGQWKILLDINFLSSHAFAHIYQTCEDNSDITYTSEFLPNRKASESLPATNCDKCNLELTTNTN